MFDPTRENLTLAVETFLAGSSVKWTGSPGYPFPSYTDNRKLVTEQYPIVVMMTVDLLEAWRDTQHNVVRSLTPAELINYKLMYLCRIFVKKEPHSTKKILTQRQRLVISVPLIVSLAQAVLYNAQNELEIQACDHIPAKAGWSATDEGFGRISDYVQGFDCELVMSDDVAQWDWSVNQYWLDEETEFTLDLQNARGTQWENMIRNADYALAATPLVLSNGEIYATLIPGGVKSGGRKTSSGNSHIRTLLRNTVNALGDLISPKAVMVMGDDCTEGVSFRDPDRYIQLYASLGFKLTDVQIETKESNIFNFCSHLWTGRQKAMPLNWAKILYRLMSKPYDQVEYDAWEYEMRQITDEEGVVTLPNLRRYLSWVRWIPEHRQGDQMQATTLAHENIYSGVLPQNLAMPGGAKNKKQKAQASQEGAYKAAMKMGKTLPTTGLKQQYSSVVSPLCRQEIATLEYAHTLANPWVEEPSGLPLILGSAVMRTNKCQLIFEGQATCNSSGFAFVLVNMDGWIEPSTGSGVPQYQYTSYSGGTQGYPIWYSGGTFVGTTLPTGALTTATTGLLAIQTKLLDGSVNAQTQVRLVASGLRVFSDAAEQTAQGKLAVVATTVPFGTAANGALVGSTYATLSGMPQDLVSWQAEPCAGWRSGHSLKAVAIPTDSTAFALFPPPATGASTVGYPQLGAILSGGATGQTFTFQVVFDYEFTFSLTNITGVRDDPIYSAPQGTLAAIQAGVTPISSGPHNKPNPSGAQAWVNEIHDRVPGRIPEIVAMTKRPMMVDNRGNGLSNLIKQALPHVANFGMSLLPGWARGALGVAGSAIKSIFG